MHGDSAPGKDHSHEHTGSENVAHTNTKAGPQDIEQQMHGVLMHGDSAPGKDHSHEHTGSENVVATDTKAGPQDIEQQMHGVLMHGDSQAGLLHHTKDNAEKSINPKFRGRLSVQNYEEYLHGVMMHGDSKPGKDHHGHSGEDENTDDKKKKEGTVNKPMDYEEYLHGVLMHNDAKPGESHVHEDEKKFQKIRKTDKPASPPDAEELMHGLLMHNDASSGYKHQEHEKKKKADSLSQPGSVLAPDIDALDESLSNNKVPGGPSFAKRKIEVKDGKDKDLEEKVKPVEESRISGYLYSIYKTIHDMKEKYFNVDKNNNNNNNNREGRSRKTEKVSEEEVGVITAEEARQHLSPTHEHKSGDMRSDLDIIGNTAPLHMNYRVHRDNRKKHKHDEG
uniref:Uncharacterized protein n=2 Tax=Octopus bimaculoides TaxID=37653 RepID=A0A0L8G269_OCTBM